MQKQKQTHTLILTNNAIKCTLFANKLKKHIGNELFVKFAWEMKTVIIHIQTENDKQKE